MGGNEFPVKIILGLQISPRGYKIKGTRKIFLSLKGYFRKKCC